MAEAFTTLGQSTLNGAISSTGATSVPVASGTSFPSSGTFRVRVDNEIMKVTANSGNTFTVVRGDGGTTAATHLTSAVITQVVTAEALLALQSDTLGLAVQASLPGGKLTLVSGTPTPSTDITGAATIYYTPHISNVVALWDGSYWQRVTFTEPSLTIGTVTIGIPLDVFLYSSSGVATLEKLAWSSATARATGISIQDGRLCKTGDKTRLWVGSFVPSSTTTTEDSGAKRYLFNAYHRVKRWVRGTGTYGVDTTIATTTVVSLSSALDIPVFVGEAQLIEVIHNSCFKNSVSTGGGVQDAVYGIGVDGTFVVTSIFSNDVGYPVNRSNLHSVSLAAGLHTLNYGWAFGAGGGTLAYDGGSRGSVSNTDSTGLQAGLMC